MKPGDFRRVLGDLNRAGVKYLVVGGWAAAFHGVNRTTFDLDLCLEMSPENVEAFWEAVGGIGYRPHLPITLKDLSDPDKIKGLIEERNLKAVNFWLPDDPSGLSLDVVIGSGLDFSEAWFRRAIVTVGEEEIAVVGKDDLVAMKKEAGRPGDLVDIGILETDD